MGHSIFLTCQNVEFGVLIRRGIGNSHFGLHKGVELELLGKVVKPAWGVRMELVQKRPVGIVKSKEVAGGEGEDALISSR